MNPFIFFGITFCMYSHVQSLNVEPVLPTINATFNATVELQWQVTLQPPEEIFKILVRMSPGLIGILSGNKDGINVDKDGTKLFGDRISGIYNKSSDIVTLTLQNIKQNETLVFELVVLLSSLVSKTANISIERISGVPIFCGKHLESEYTIKENISLTIAQDICGNPKPTVKWRVGENKFSKVTTSTKINNATGQYNYTFNTRALNRTDCGKNLTITASNTEGSIDRHAKIYVNFTPFPVVITASKRHNKSCVFVKWNKKETGNCVIAYHLQFNTKMAIYNTTKTDFTFCNLPNASNVTVWASYRGNISKKVNSAIEETTTTTTQTTITSKTGDRTSNTTISTKQVIKNSSDDTNIGLIIGIVGGILFVIIVIIIVVCVLKHKKKNGTGNHSGYAMRVTGEENNYVTDPTHRNRRQPANPDDPEQAIYSELGPGGGRTGPRPAPEQSDYAEMKVDAMGYPIDGAKASEPPTYAPVIKPREGAKRRTPSPPRSNVDGARAAASSEPPAYAPIMKNRSSSRGRSPPPDEDDHEGVIV
uniref:Allorecognition 1 n=1 Tax=Hydractinia symbiolongicarpus TaxID=13093 RepID=D9ZHS5_HYDSY|nr:allorecognition 1 [Hydractinia symbiolongicarpus]